MGQHHKQQSTHLTPTERQVREQEVLRANQELSAYFKGRRTEREARAALKIIKAFVRERESLDAGSRPPLPGFGPTRTTKPATKRKASARDGDSGRAKVRHKSLRWISTKAEAPAPAPVTHEPERSSPKEPTEE
jgi:hypothetical protein